MGDFIMEREDKNMQAEPSEAQETPKKQPQPKGYEAYLSLFDLVRMLAVITLVFVFFFRLNGVSGSSMYPTLVDKDYLVLESNFLYRDAKQGDIVVLYTPPFSENDELLVKRVIAVGGQTVDIDFNAGVVYVDGQALDEVARVYAEVVAADLCRASGIRVAEAAKMTENVQRSVNIALMNELQRLFSRMGIDMGEVIDMASSKWNFVKYRPGLGGGHCIPVDPLYLVSAASKLGVEMPVTSSGCAVNDGMAAYVVRSLLGAMGSDGRGARALLMGVTYKENIDDIRNSRIAEMVGLLEREGMSVDVTDPHADRF